MPKANVNEQCLAYDLLGEGEPVAFLNGILMTIDSWVLQTSLLRHRYRCLVHDFRGQLLSSKPLEPWTMGEHGDDFVALLDELGIDKCHLVGTSYGGEVGLILAARHPERIASLTVVASVSEVDERLDRAVARWAETALTAPERLYDDVAELAFSAEYAAANTDLMAQGRARLASCPPEFFPAFARLVEAFRGLDLTPDLSAIEVPTLVVAGELDALKPPSSSRLIASRIRGSECLLVPGAGHAVVLERPHEINTAIVGFLEKHRRS
jgi:3-oxoadipate enol-lactonase